MKNKPLTIMIITALLFAMIGVGTMAWFTSTAISENNVFETGTLELGTGLVGSAEEDVANEFASLTFNDLSPGGDPTAMKQTLLKNVGSLPFYIYRITADDFTDNNDDDIDDTMLDEVLMIEISITDENENEVKVFRGRLKQLLEENGGYFDPMYHLAPQDTCDMILKVWMNDDAGNDYQGLSMSCDFTVYARQIEMPLPGDSEKYEYLASSDVYDGNGNPMNDNNYFQAWGKNEGNLVKFQYRWYDQVQGIRISDPDVDLDWYELRIKHHTGDANQEIIIKVPNNSGGEIEVYDNDNRLTTVPADSLDFDYHTDTVTMSQEFFNAIGGASWDTIEVQFYGKTHQGDWDRTTPYTWWNLPY